MHPVKSINRLSDLSSYEEFIWQLPGMFCIKDTEARFVTSNKKLMELLGFETLSDLAGRSDFEIRCEAVQFAEKFGEEDQNVLQGQTHEVVNVARFAEEDISIILGEKKPLINYEQQIIGVLCQYLKLPVHQMRPVLSHLQHYEAQENIVGCYTIGGLYDDFKLSDREAECLHYTLRGHSAKKIAIFLGLSAKTVEFHLHNLKIKFQVLNKAQLIEKAITEGFMFNIPKNLIKH